MVKLVSGGTRESGAEPEMEMCLTIQESKVQLSKLIEKEARKNSLSGTWTSHDKSHSNCCYDHFMGGSTAF